MGRITKLAVVMDPIESIKIHKDSTFAMLLEAQHRSWEIHYIPPRNLFVLDGKPLCHCAPLTVHDDPACWHQLGAFQETTLQEFDVILMRQDPPFNMEYIYTTYALELAQHLGTCIVNNPIALRNLNEKFAITNFPQCCVPTLVSREISTINSFIQQTSRCGGKTVGRHGRTIYLQNHPQ